MSEKNYNLSEIDDIADLPEDTKIVLDDRPRKYDIQNRRVVSPGELGYDDLPEIKY